MTAVQPFSYLTGGPAPPKAAFRRQEDLDETAVFRSGDPSAPDDISHLGQSLTAAPNQLDGHFGQALVTTPNHLDFQRSQVTLGQAPAETIFSLRQQHQQLQPEGGAVYTGNRPDGVAANGYNRLKQWESPVNDQRKPSEAAFAKRPPDVAPKQTKALDPPCITTEKSEEPNRDGVYGVAKALNSQLQLRKVDNWPENMEVIKEPVSGNASNLRYGHVNRYRGPDSLEAGKMKPQCTPNDCSVPPSFNHSTGSLGAVTYGDMESCNGGSSTFQSQSALDSRTREHPKVGATESLNIFENFILVGPEKSQSKEVAPKEPVKRLKLQELFDPPPPSMMSHDPHKVSILGVTNTESCDHRSTPDYSKTKDSDRTKAKQLVSTFDNPDYNLQDRTFASSSSMQGLREDRPWSPGANNILGGAGRGSSSHEKRPVQGRCVVKNLCAAVLITALVTSIVCLGAGFIAGWFGRGRALGP